MQSKRLVSLLGAIIILAQSVTGIFGGTLTASADTQEVDQDLTALKQYSYYAAFRSCLLQGRAHSGIAGGNELNPESGFFYGNAFWAYLGFVASDASGGEHNGGVWCRDVPGLVVANLGISTDQLMTGLEYTLANGDWKSNIADKNTGAIDKGKIVADWDKLAQSKGIQTTEAAYDQYYLANAALIADKGCKATQVDSPTAAQKSAADTQSKNMAWITLVTDTGGATQKYVYQFDNLGKGDIHTYPKPNDPSVSAGAASCKDIARTLSDNGEAVTKYVSYLKAQFKTALATAVRDTALKYCQGLSGATASSGQTVQDYVNTCVNTVVSAQEKCWAKIPVPGTLPVETRDRTIDEKASCLKDSDVPGGTGGINGLVANIDTALSEVKTQAVGAPSNTTTKTASTCTVPSVGWIVCPVTKFLGNIADGATGMLNTLLAVPATKMFDTSKDDGVYAAWQSMRNYANILFVIAFLVIIFSQVTSIGITNYGIKKLLPKLVIVAVLVNVSFFICALAVDLSNVLGYGMSNFLAATTGNLTTAPANTASQGNIFTDILVGLTTAATLGLVAYFALAAVTGIVISAVAIGVTMIILLGLRQGLIILLVVASPVALVTMLLPNTNGIYKKWLNLLKSMLLIFPIAGLLYGAGKMAQNVLTVPVNDSMQGMIVSAIGAAMPVIMLVAVYKVFTSSMNAISGVGAFANGLRGGIKRAANPLRSLAGASDKLNRQRFLAGNSLPGTRHIGRFVTRRRAGYESRMNANKDEAAANAAEHVERTQQRFTDRSKIASERKDNAVTASDNAASRNLLATPQGQAVLARKGQLRENKRAVAADMETHMIQHSQAERRAADVSDKIKTNTEMDAKNESLRAMQAAQPGLLTEEARLAEVQRGLNANTKTLQMQDRGVTAAYQQANIDELETKEFDTQRTADWKDVASSDATLVAQSARIAGQEDRAKAADEVLEGAMTEARADGTMSIANANGTAQTMQQIQESKQDAEKNLEYQKDRLTNQEKAHEATSATQQGLRAAIQEQKEAANVSESEIEKQDKANLATDQTLIGLREDTQRNKAEAKASDAAIDAQDKELAATDAAIQASRANAQDQEAIGTRAEAEIKAQDKDRAATDAGLKTLREGTQIAEAEATRSEAQIKAQDKDFAANDQTGTMQDLRYETQVAEAEANRSEAEIKRQDAEIAVTDSDIVRDTNAARALNNAASEAKRQEGENYRTAILADPSLLAEAGGSINPKDGRQRAEASARAEVDQARTKEVSDARIQFANQEDNASAMAKVKDTNAAETEREAALLHIMEKGSHDEKLAAIEAAINDSTISQTTRSVLADTYARSSLAELHGKGLAGEIRLGGRAIKDENGKVTGKVPSDLKVTLIRNLGDIQPGTVAGNSNYASSLREAYETAEKAHTDDPTNAEAKRTLDTATKQLKALFAKIHATPTINGTVTENVAKELDAIGKKIGAQAFSGTTRPTATQSGATMGANGLWAPDPNYKPSGDK